MPAYGDKLVLRIKAVNPIEKPQKVQIKSNLPQRVSTNDVIDLDGLELGYDVKSGIYYVHKDVELGPKEVVTFNVEIDDIWVIPEEEIDKLRKQAVNLVGKLQGTEYQGSVDALQGEIESNLDLIQRHQAENAIRAGIKAVQHLRAYESNLEVLQRIKKDIRHLENLILGAGQDPGGLVWYDTIEIMPKRDIELIPSDYKTAIFRITVSNTSPTETRKIFIKRDLPREIKFEDVLDGGGLDVATDPKSGICYVYKENVEVGPDETIDFDVKIRDKWNVNALWIQSLKKRTGDVLARIDAKEQYESINKILQGLIADIEKISNEHGPDTLNDKYVAFYRDQTARLALIDRKINRIGSVLRPMEKGTLWGFDLKAPSMKTTWMIIYIILGFLAVISLLFFLRWFGKTKAEKMEE